MELRSISSYLLHFANEKGIPVGPNVNGVRLLLPNLCSLISQMGLKPILAYREIVRVQS